MCRGPQTPSDKSSLGIVSFIYQQPRTPPCRVMREDRECFQITKPATDTCRFYELPGVLLDGYGLARALNRVNFVDIQELSQEVPQEPCEAQERAPSGFSMLCWLHIGGLRAVGGLTLCRIAT